jgi:predicted O-methyltransferase YrrM
MIHDHETSNFTYEITNADELVTFLRDHFVAERDLIASYVEEVETNIELRESLDVTLQQRKGKRSHARYGRRIGWYALVRLIRPRVVVETGVHDGLGSSVLLSALARNSIEGNEGRLIAIDLDPDSGWLVPIYLRSRLELVIDDAVSVLQGVQPASIDLFIHDSLHAYDYQSSEYAAVEPGLSPTAVIIADDAHDVPALADFSRARGRPYAEWHENANHFYGGSSIGVSLPPPQTPCLTEP